MSTHTSEALVSGALERELRDKVRAKGLVVWLDADGTYTGFVDRKAASGGEVGGFRVVGYRGSFLELMLAMEPLGSGVDKPKVVVHVPGLRPEDLVRSPLCELWRAGTQYERRLDTLITAAAAGRATPDTIAAFVVTKPTLEAADAWLGRVADEGSAGIKSQLRTLGLNGLFDDLIGRGPLAIRIVDDALDRAAAFEQIEAWMGLDAAWREATLDASHERAPSRDGIMYAVASFAMAAEYVFDLKRPPYSANLKPLTALSVPLREACRSLCGHLRERHPELYQRIADQAEADFPDEVAQAEARDLGKVDTFRFEEDKVLGYAMDALDALAYDEALALSEPRSGPPDETSSFWTRRPERRAAWLVVRDAARLGLAIDRAPVSVAEKAGGDGLDRLVETYVEFAAEVDRAHRRLEQRRLTSLFPEVPYFEKIRRCADAMRIAWLDWAERWAAVTAKVSRAHGLLAPRPLMQRTVFDDVVMPIIREGRESREASRAARGAKGPAELPTVLFLVDALRFEMVDELFAEMAAVPHTTASLSARLAELPTLTAVGMNAIAPATVSEGPVPRLRPILEEGASRIAVTGFSTGTFRIDNRANRWRAMFDRAGGDCAELSLDQVVSLDKAALKGRVSRARLVVVHSLELDDAGESGVGPMVFDQVLQKLRAAWKLLREVDVRRFVVTSDHGFLLLEGIRRPPEVQGRKTDPDRRHVLTRNAASEPGRLRVPLGELGYEGGDGVYLVMSETTNVFDRGARQTSFVHGGNSLQERVVPVVSAVHRSAPGGSAGRYRILAERGDGVAGMHRVSGRVELVLADQMSLSFAQAKTLDVELKVAAGSLGQVEVVQSSSAAVVVASNTLRVEVGKPFEVFFRISGASHERVQLAVSHTGGALEVEPVVVSDWFEAVVAPAVVGGAERSGGSVKEAANAGGVVAVAQGWAEAVNPEYRKVYERIASHGLVEEAEVAQMLGGPRQARRFARELEQDLAKLPFSLRVEAGDDGKRWVREGGGR